MPDHLSHKPGCAFGRSHPSEGDEAALCDCGAVEAAMYAHMEATARAANERIANCHKEVACPRCGAVVGDRCHRVGALYLPGYTGYAPPPPLKHPHRERWTQVVPAR